MSVEAEQLEDWIGSEVVDPQGTKLGKVEDVYYQGSDPVIVEVKSGITGRKHALAALAGATVSVKHLRLNVAETLDTNGGIDAESLGQLAQHDPRLAGVTVEQLESGSHRQARILEAEEAGRNASVLETEAANRAEEAKIAAQVANDATARASEAEQARATAAAQAAAARQRATELQTAL